MGQEFVLDESEISLAVNKITTIIQFLQESVDSYISILEKVETEGINDDLVCSKLESLAAIANLYRKKLETFNTKFSADINTSISSVEDSDNFQFPSDLMTYVTYLLSNFL